ncbi:hypothetical protein ACN26Y_10885 [Micromonospora sp. WMMD558]|uniref:hypothetical protein n=1 Tax=unclassified Micromonospora TaxID=2617518 RepID=UPI0012B45963|nr:hypothetical protein [Micromonospora sp. WMMC415]QGN46756.1 hypothetical protein GKC29_07785 [Micromonospora sp. WMMC415]
MTTRTGHRAAIALLGAATALFALAAPAVAAPDRKAASLDVGRLVLDPTDRGYRGSLPVTVTNLGTTATYYSVTFVEPVGGSFEGLTPEEACVFNGLVDNRRQINCMVPGSLLEPGERRRFTVNFHALTPTRDVAMTIKGGLISVNSGDGRDDVADRERFTTLFRSTTGSLRNPVPYVQDQQADVSITTAGAVTLTPQEDGSYLGRLPVTVTWDGDAAHEHLSVEAIGLPAGVMIWGTDPQDLPSFFTWFAVPGEQFIDGETRTFDVLLRAEPGTAPGALGTVTFDLDTMWDGNVVPDPDPADNTASFTVTVAAAS